jgi:DNA-binding MarR family transcriptional regulator
MTENRGQLTRQEWRVYQALRRFLQVHGISPTLTELATVLCPQKPVTKVTIFRHLHSLVAKGWIAREGRGRTRTYYPTNFARLQEKADRVREVLRRYANVDPQARELMAYLWPSDLADPFL